MKTAERQFTTISGVPIEPLYGPEDAPLELPAPGEFPYTRVFAVIDGRNIVPSHGKRDMPVWGRQFLEEDFKLYGPSGGEIVTTERIHELAGYVQTLQR